MSKVSFDPVAVGELCRTHNLNTPLIAKDGRELQFDGLPILPFLIELAQLHGLSPDMLKVEHIHGGEGCETCGYGNECEFIVREA